MSTTLGDSGGPAIRDRIIDLRRVPASLIEGAPWNWRTHGNDQRAAVRESLKELGIIDALKVRELPGGRYQLWDGHLREDEYMGIGPDTIVPILVTDLDEAEAKKANVIFDPLAAMAGSDAAKLDELLREVQTGDALEAMLKELARKSDCDWGRPAEIVEDEVPVEVEPVTKPGDLWLLGEHRLLCGDSTKAEDVARVMGGERAAACIADPPYGIRLENHAPGKQRSRRSFNIAGDDSQAVGIAALSLCEGMPIVAFASPMKPWPGDWKQFLVWDKGGAVGGGGDPSTYWKPTWELIQVAKTGKLNGQRDNAVLTYHIGPRFDFHVAQKPVALIAYLLEKVTDQGEVVYEPFCGSGSQLIAAEQLSRRCYAIEIEPRYCDVAIARWEKLTSRKAVLQ